MSLRTPVPRNTGPVAPLLIASFKLIAPMLTKRDFQIRLEVSIVKISVSVLKQSLAKNVTSRKNCWFNPVQSMSFGR
jgi:hypothetical protein